MITVSFTVPSSFSPPVSESSASNSSNRSWKTRFNQACPSIVSKWMPSEVSLACSMALNSCSMSIRIILPAFRFARFLMMLFHLMTPSLCLLPDAVRFLAFIGTVQTVSTAQLNFCQRVVNKHTIIDSHCASCSSDPLEISFVPTNIITLGILPGFISSTIRYNWGNCRASKGHHRGDP